MKRTKYRTIRPRGKRGSIAELPPQSDTDVDTLKRMLDEGQLAHAGRERWTLDVNGRSGIKAPGRCCWCQRRVAVGALYCCALHEKAHAEARARRVPFAFLPYPSTAEQRRAFLAALRGKKKGG